MRTEPVKIDEFKDCFCSGILLSQRLKWGRDSAEDEDKMISALLAIVVVDAEGEPVKTVREWDEWGGENGEVHDLFAQCLGMIGTAKAAKKN